MLNDQCESPCPDEYWADNSLKKCQSCSTIPHCKKCLDMTTCNLCDSDSFYLKNGNCNSCSDLSCQRCLGENQCQQCVAGKYLLNGACINYCGEGYWPDSGNLKCEPCDSSCLTCNGPSSSKDNEIKLLYF